MIEKPYFLVGAERSGTTLLRLMLSHHPQIAWCNEFEYTVDKISSSGQFPQLNDYYEWLETHRIFQDTGFVIDYNLNYPELMNSFLQQKQEEFKRQIVGATVHRNFDKLLIIWPKARFIHLIRDPRDVASSCVKMGWAGHVWFGVDRWLEAEKCWDRVKSLIFSEQYIEIFYEDLISNPEKQLSIISNFLGVSYDENMVEIDQTTTYSSPDSRFIKQWKNKLSKKEVQLIEIKTNDFLKERGYEDSGYEKMTISKLEKQKLKLNSFIIRSYRRFKENPRLFLMGYLIRRWGNKSLNQWLKRKENDLARSKLK